NAGRFVRGRKWVGALPAKLFLIKPMYFNALKSGGAMILYHQKYTLASRFLMRQTQKNRG
ncbi:hypothetical protein YI18_26535, partial [Salmonella enterica]|nr:hypothetical protein [Salmonella enterica]